MLNALKISREVAEVVREEVSKIAGKKEAGIEVGMGKDGTPTKKVDRIAENAALSVLSNYDLKVVSEESGVVGEGDVVVALDPVDGTFNAERGIPFYSVSLCFSNSESYGGAFFGYVFNLATGDEYYADQTAYKNGERIEASKTEEVSKANAIFYYPHRKLEFKRVRIFGAASLEICLVADGSVDCFVDIRNMGKGMLRVYDVAAGMYIAEKAGAKVTSPQGESVYEKRFTMDERFNLVIANKKLHKNIIETVIP